MLNKSLLESILKQHGYTNWVYRGNSLNLLVDIPTKTGKADYRKTTLDTVMGILRQEFPDDAPEYNFSPNLSSVGGIVFGNNPLKIVIKDAEKQGQNGYGCKNETILANMIQTSITQYGKINLEFKDQYGHSLSMQDVNSVVPTGRDVANRKKADLIISNGYDIMPLSIKQSDAEIWESADSAFGGHAKSVLDKLILDGKVELKQIGQRETRYSSMPVYALNKEVVIEPTNEDIKDVVFGSDIMPKGGVIIQTFNQNNYSQQQHYVNITCNAVIAKPEDIPKSHSVNWLLRNDSTRNSKSIGIAGLRPFAVTESRVTAKSTKKNMIRVDLNGNVT
jgi:hypothetical protein